MSIAPPGRDKEIYRVIEHDGFAEVELLTPLLPEELGEALCAEAADRHWSRILLECSRVQFISSLGLGALLRLDRQLRPLGGRLRLCGLDRDLRDLFRITHIDRVVQICDDRDSAIAMQW